MNQQSNRKKDILTAALSCFTDMGIAATSIDDIRLKSGASIGSIYHHFSNKEGLATALFREGLEGYRQGLIDVLSEAQSGEVLVKGAVDFHVEWALAHPDKVRFMLYAKREMSVLADDAVVREETGDFLSRVKALFTPFIIKGEIRQFPKELYIPLLSGPSQELIRIWLSHPKVIDLKGMKPYLAEAAWNALRPSS
ncbi:MAG: TetR/AcrR family transcriptional regulator [Rhodospirillales bacterium]|nr:TetR/AcrR family transcriptional regulator [Rhodospirillales bacterium]